MLVDRPCIFMDAYNAWQRYIDEIMTVDVFERAFTDMKKLTISTKLRDFQYRLLHKRLPTNHELYRWKLKNTEMCEMWL